MKKINFIILSFFITLNFFGESELKEPSWVYLKNAENLCTKGDYAQAIVEAKKSRVRFIDEKLEKYYDDIFKTLKNKTQYELKKLVEVKRDEYYKNDDYPQYHEMMADLYVKTNFLDEAVKEYNISLSQKKFFDYPDKFKEIKYKIAHVYNKKNEFELEDILYREIAKEYFDKKPVEYWDRIKLHIKNDKTLNNAFKIYRIGGIEYLEALYKIGRRSSILQRNEEALFYLTNACLIWFTYNSNIIKKYNFDFQYNAPSDFINYLKKIRVDYDTWDDPAIIESFFYIGYINYLEKRNELRDYFFNLAIVYSKNTKIEEEMKNRINYFKIDKNYIIKFDDIK